MWAYNVDMSIGLPEPSRDEAPNEVLTYHPPETAMLDADIHTLLETAVERPIHPEMQVAEQLVARNYTGWKLDKGMWVSSAPRARRERGNLQFLLARVPSGNYYYITDEAIVSSRPIKGKNVAGAVLKNFFAFSISYSGVFKSELYDTQIGQYNNDGKFIALPQVEPLAGEDGMVMAGLEEEATRWDYFTTDRVRGIINRMNYMLRKIDVQ